MQRVLAVYDWYVRIYGKAALSTELPVLPEIGRQVEAWWHRARQVLDRWQPTPAFDS